MNSKLINLTMVSFLDIAESWQKMNTVGQGVREIRIRDAALGDTLGDVPDLAGV